MNGGKTVDPKIAFVIGRMRAGDKKLTYQDLLHPAVMAKTKYNAALFLKEYRRYLMKTLKASKKRAEYLAKVNIGYYSGYYDSKTMARVRKLYGFGHPIFG